MIIDVQKKVAQMLGEASEETDPDEPS